MHYHKSSTWWLAFLILVFVFACNHDRKTSKSKKQKELVTNPASIDVIVQKNIEAELLFAADNNGKIEDSIQLGFLPALSVLFRDTSQCDQTKS